MNLMGVGPIELMVILVVALLVLGPARLAPTARTLGKLLRDVRSSTEKLPSLVEDFIENSDSSVNSEKRSVDNSLPTPDGTKSRSNPSDNKQDVHIQDEIDKEKS